MPYLPGKCLLPSILRKRRITAQELAGVVGMSKQQISDYANNRFVMSLKTAKNIAHHLQIPIDDLYEWIEE
jgi:DNA-binding XRE family transcriptional regulator